MQLQWAVKLRVIVITLLLFVCECVSVCVLLPIFPLTLNYQPDGEPTRGHTHICYIKKKLILCSVFSFMVYLQGYDCMWVQDVQLLVVCSSVMADLG